PRPRGPEPAPAPPAPSRAPLSPATAPQEQGSFLLAGRSTAPPNLEAASRPGPTGDRPPLAPPRLAPLLAVAFRHSSGPASVEFRDPEVDRDYGQPEPALGH